MKNRFLLAEMIAIGLMVGRAFAIEEYSQCSNGELSTGRGTMQHNAFEEHKALPEKGQNRTRDLPSAERAQHRTCPDLPMCDKKRQQVRKSRNVGKQNQWSYGGGRSTRSGSARSNRW